MPRSLETARGLCTIAACGHYGLEQLCAVALALSFATMTKVCVCVSVCLCVCICVCVCWGGVSTKRGPVPTPDERGENDTVTFPSSVLKTHMLHAHETTLLH